MCGSTFSFITDPIENLLSGANDAIDSASRGVGGSIGQAAPAILAAVAMYYGIPASSVGAAEIAGAAEAGAITAADVAVATPYIDAGMVTGTALDAGAAGAAGAGGAIADQVPFNSLINAGTTYVAPGGVGGAMAGVGTGADIVGSDWASGLPTTNGVAGIGSDAATTGLIQQLATYTGLSTDAITRLGGAAISSLASMYGAGKLSQASLSAANRLATANQGATALQTQMYNDQVARQQPFYQAGLNALPAYSQGVMPGGSLVKPFAATDFQADPGYAFRVSEGLKALDRTAAARGGLLSGATLKGAENYNQNMASNEYNNAYNRYVSDQATQRNALAGLTGFAPTAAQQISNAGTNYATNVNNLSTNTATNYANADLTGAAARQSAYTGAGGAFANALTPNPLNAYLNKQLGLA
jgi:hypothetical protein